MVTPIELNSITFNLLQDNMTESLALELVERYLKNHKYDPKRIDTKKLQSSRKAPDFEVNENDVLKFYCEIKTPALKPSAQTRIFHWTTIISKLRDLIHKAVKQFKNQDPNHLKPWVLIFTSDHFQLNWSNFVHCLQGAVAYNSQIIKDLSNQRFIVDTQDDIKTIDLFVWCQVNAQAKRIYQMVHFVNGNSDLLEKIKAISSKLIPYASESIMNKSSRKYT